MVIAWIILFLLLLFIEIITVNLVTIWFALGALIAVICYVIYRIIYKLGAYFIEDNDNFLLISGAMVLILQIIMVFVTFKLANIQAFKKGTIYKSDVGKVVKNISFVVIVLLLSQVLLTFTSVNSVVEETINDDLWLKYREKKMYAFYDDDEIEIYQTQKEKEIQELKNELYQYLAIVETGTIIIYVTAIILEKKSLYKRAE